MRVLGKWTGQKDEISQTHAVDVLFPVVSTLSVFAPW